MTVTIYKDEAANAIFVQDNNGAQFMNNLQVVMENPTDTSLHIRDKSKDNYLFYAIPHDHVVDQDGNTYGATPVLACNALNALVSAAGGSDGVAPVITSSTAVSLTGGDTLNYELVATDGVGYEWANLPSGVTTVDGNVRKLIGGSSLPEGTYNITAKAINYFGEDTETITLTVSAPAFSNTKSVKFQNQDYLGANAAPLDSVLGRSGNGSGSSDAWTISMWVKPEGTQNNQTLFFYGGNDVSNEGNIWIRYYGGTSLQTIRLQYGSDNNRLTFIPPDESFPRGQWTHLLITYDGGTTGSSSGDLADYYSRFSIYSNGVLQTTSNGHTNYGFSGEIKDELLQVGREGNEYSYMRSGGKVDGVAVWGSDQSSNVSDIYNSGTPRDLSSLTSSPDHWWRMGDGDTYPTIQDNVGTAHFVMYNMTAADIVTDTP